jgi:putative oxygen-independent coproporphyrinogen III oxidase
MSQLGIYIHFPWCRNLCPYCDFPVVVARPGREPPHQAYRDAVLAELAARAPAFAGRQLVSVYLGGGTPSLWQPEAIGAVVRAAAARFAADPDTLEVTIEANPTDCTAARMAAWRQAGIGRVSIGVQSLASEELVVLGRDHRQGDGAAAVAAALAAGFASVSADVILGAPTGGAPAPSAARLAAAGVPHLSAYELTIEPRTRLGRDAARGALVPRDEDALAALYLATHDTLAGAGYQHYEVSSYARPGHRAVHNGLYWRGAEFLGLGVGAASFRIGDDGRGIREVNVRQAPRYLRGERHAETTVTSAAELAVDRLWLGLRTLDGVAAAEVTAAGRAGVVDQLIAEGLCEPAGARVRPTLRGFLYNDRIARRLVGNR